MMTYNPGQDDEDKNGIGDTCDDFNEFGPSNVVNKFVVL